MAGPVRMPPEQWARLINPTNLVDCEEENESINMVLDRLSELTAILLFRLSDTHSESLGLIRPYKGRLVRDLDKLWDEYGVRKFGGDDDA